MTHCSIVPTQVGFSFFTPQVVTAAFDDGAVTSNAGVALLAQLDKRISWTKRVAGCLQEERDRRFLQHSLHDLVRQRVFQIALGYEDANDSDQLRGDPLLKAACGRHPDKGADLASQPTFSRFENDRFSGEVDAANRAFLAHYLDKRKGKPAPREIVIDIDSTDDQTYGQQELAFFHGHYDGYIYHPLLCFDGDTGELLAVVLRPGDAGAAQGAAQELRWIVYRLREAWPRVKLLVRADSGFATPELYDLCEAERVEYVIGFPPNARLSKLSEPLAKQAEEAFERFGTKARLYAELEYRARTWDRDRRIILKAEHDAKGANTRYVITSRRGARWRADRVYDCYRRHATVENRIKDLKNALFADRLSCSRFMANATRLVLHAAAYVLMWELRALLDGTELGRAQFDTLRLRLLKIGARVVTTARRIWLHMTSACPDREAWMLLAHRLTTSTA